MRILLLSVDFPPATGGIQNLLAHLAAGLSWRHDVTVVAPRRDGDGAWDATCRHRVTRAPRAHRWPLVMSSFLCTGIIATLPRRPSTVVCGHALLGPPCWTIARLFGVPLVVIAHAYEIRAPRMRTLAGWTLRHADMVVSVSNFTRRSVLSYGVAPDRVVVINPGAASQPSTIGTIAIGPEPTQTPAPRERVILTVARLGELYKGHDMMIRALPLILAREPLARYVVVGDGPLRPYLSRLARSLGVDAAVTFAGEVTDADLDRWYRRADLFVLLSRESPVDGGAEGYGLTFIEAGVRGKPVIGGNSGGIPDAVVDGITGLLVDPTDVGAIADAVLRVLEDAQLAASLGARGRDRAVNELSWTNFTAAFEAVLERVTLRRPDLGARHLIDAETASQAQATSGQAPADRRASRLTP